MITTIISRFEAQKNNRKVVAVYNYQNKAYLIEAPLKGVDVDYNNPFFLTDKNVTSIQPFLTTLMMKEFKNAINKPVWKLRKGK